MPFTVSHVAAVLPLRGRRPGRGPGQGALPLAPLALGSMSPDVWLFLGVSRLRELAHSPLGIVTVDLAVVVLAGLVWHHFLRPPVLAMLPPLAARLPPTGRSGAIAQPHTPGWAATWVLAALIGATTHVVWDLFTHGDSGVLRRLPFLQGTSLGVDRELWLQYGSSVVGLLLVAAVAAHWWWTTPPRLEPESVSARPARVAVLVGLAAVTVAGAAYRGDPMAFVSLVVDGKFWPWRLRTFTTDVALGAVMALVVSVVVVAVGWHVIDARNRRSRAAGTGAGTGRASGVGVDGQLDRQGEPGEPDHEPDGALREASHDRRSHR